MNAEDFLTDVIRPVLMSMDMHTRNAEKLLLMTAVHESGGFRWKKQIKGPALSWYQIEPRTLEDLYKNWLAYRVGKKMLLDRYGYDDTKEALMDDVFATAAARLIYARVAEPIPDNEAGMARYWKTYWNTTRGKGTVEGFLENWKLHGLKGY